MGIYEFYSRGYDAVSGVWLQQDKYRGQISDPQSLLRYKYVNQNPVNYKDWYGYIDISIGSVFSALTKPGWAIDIIGTALHHGCSPVDSKCMVSRLESCYVSSDSECVADIYDYLGDGGDIQGLGIAGTMMHQFLSGSGEDVQLQSSDFTNDINVKEIEQNILTSIKDTLRKSQQNICVQILSSSGSYNTSADPDSNSNLWYGVGRFQLEYSYTAKLTLDTYNNIVVDVRIDFSVEDRYDWHPEANLIAGGGVEGVEMIKDEWGQYLVDQGKAKPFNMFANWTKDYIFVTDSSFVNYKLAYRDIFGGINVINNF